MYAGERQFRSECCEGSRGLSADNLGFIPPGAVPAAGGIIADIGGFLDDIDNILAEIPVIGGLFGGGLRPCEKQAAQAAKAASQVPPERAAQAVNQLGGEAVRRIVNFPPQSEICVTGEVPIACASDFDRQAYERAGGDAVAQDAARLLSAAGVSGIDAGGCSEVIQVAKIVVGQAAKAAQRDPAPGGNGNGVVRSGLPGWAVPVGLGALALFMSSR